MVFPCVTSVPYVENEGVAVAEETLYKYRFQPRLTVESHLLTNKGL